MLIVLLIVSAAATLATQLLVRSNQTVAPEGTAATIQRVMLWIIPVGVLASGLLFNFPLGVLLYWFTSNLWTLGQQAYIIRFHPHVEEPTKPVGELGKTLAPAPRPAAGPDDEGPRPNGGKQSRGRGRARRAEHGGRPQRAPSGAATEPAGRQAAAGEAPHPSQETALSATRPGPGPGIEQERIHCL